MTSEELTDKEKELCEIFVDSLDIVVESIIQKKPYLAHKVAEILGAFVCKLAIERHGKSEAAQEIIGKTMATSWEAIQLVTDES